MKKQWVRIVVAFVIAAAIVFFLANGRTLGERILSAIAFSALVVIADWVRRIPSKPWRLMGGKWREK